MILTIPATIQKIATDVQGVANELIKQMLKKSIRLPEKANNYSYILSNQCIGWTDNAVTNFKLYAKFIKNNKARNIFPVAYSPRERIAYENSVKTIDNKELPYKKFVDVLTAENIQTLIINNQGGVTYTCDVLYTDSFQQLETIGIDILKQIHPSIPCDVSAKLSTAVLRMKLYTLEQDLEIFAVNNPIIYNSYLDMVNIINSIQREEVDWVITLIGNLSYKRWDELTQSYRNTFILHLGQVFIDRFNSNELITILLQSGAGELILTSSYMYSLLKMLFIVFGYNGFIPYLVSNPCPDGNVNNSSCHPSEKCTMEIVDKFQDLYPTINEIMVGCEIIPNQGNKVACSSITPNYDNLFKIPDFIWKFTEFSYCKYRDYYDSRILANALTINSKISGKINYLKSYNGYILTS